MGKNRNNLDQEEKRIVFKEAFENIKRHQADGNYLAAYVVAFSVVEDRLRAMYCVWYKSENGEPPTDRQIQSPISKITKILLKEKIIGVHEAEEILSEAKSRNKLFHSAMWNLNDFTDDVLKRVLVIARNVDRFSKRQRRKHSEFNKEK